MPSKHSFLRTCIFSDHKKNNLQEEFYFESRPADPRIRAGQTGGVCGCESADPSHSQASQNGSFAEGRAREDPEKPD